jgi:UTP-glucose-1-phosphate uridylyltransferase
MVGMQVVNSKELQKVGVATGRFLRNKIYKCTDIVEKPDITTAKKRLTTIGLNKDQFLAHCGIYIFTTEILSCLKSIIVSKINRNMEIGLTEAQKMLLGQYPDDYYLVQIDGKAYDTGHPSGYILAQQVFRSKETYL